MVSGEWVPPPVELFTWGRNPVARPLTFQERTA
jgi:hypothetical protein